MFKFLKKILLAKDPAIEDALTVLGGFKLEPVMCKDIGLLLREVDRAKEPLYLSLKHYYPQGSFAKLLALKIINLIVAKYHYHYRHTTLTSRPFHFLVDPSNSCQLHCPGCVHTCNEDWQNEADWPNAILDFDQYSKFMKMFGPFLFAGQLFNYGEPFLNRRIHDFVHLAKSYMVFTNLSSNLSLPKIDAEALVKSGVDYLQVSIDGATQDAYEKFRRGGRLDWVLKNVKEIIDIRAKLSQKKPYIVWVFLTFEHNIHELDAAIKLAQEIGFDAIEVRTPFDVSSDDPFYKAVQSPKQGVHVFDQQRAAGEFDLSTGDIELVESPEIDAYLHESYYERMLNIGSLEQESYHGKKTCGYLYKNISMDGAGRIIPCCASPSKSVRHLVFGHIADADFDYELFNSPDMCDARLGIVNPVAFDKKMEGREKMKIPFCRRCLDLLEPSFDLNWIAKSMPSIDSKNSLSQDFIEKLTRWG